MQRLLLIDGNAILHRAYHAYPLSLTNPKGDPINAVYGFFSMLLMVIVHQKPDYLVVSFDRAKPTFRQSMFAGYHANRPKLTDDFISQIDIVYKLLETMKAAVIYLDGYEADDVIGTLAFQAVTSAKKHRTKTQKNTEEMEVVILTGDRDLLQLVNSHVKVLMPLIGITKTVLFDEASVEEKYGVTPKQFIDYKALIGDPSDGYPGVTGIGPKTASNLLKQYNTFENLYLHVGELPEKTGHMLAIDAEQAALAKKLATIITDVPIQFDVTKCKVTDFDIPALREEFEKHGFNSLLKRMDSVFGSVKQSSAVEKYEKKEKPSQLELL